MEKTKLILAILDGWGLAPAGRGNAISLARKPILNMIERDYPAFPLQASGIAVGLPWGEEGNSEVGHLNLGAGTIVFQYLPRINNAIKDGSFFENQALKKAAGHVKVNGTKLHIMGLFSSGSVHSYLDHWHALIEFAKRENLEDVVLHIFTDGKDSKSGEGAEFVKKLKNRLGAEKVGRIGTIIGRAFAMDRNQHWELTQKTYELLTAGAGFTVTDPVKHLEDVYKNGGTDLDMEPIVVSYGGPKSNLIEKGDALIFTNFREDSARQLTEAFTLPEEEFASFPRKKVDNLLFVAMTEYEKFLPMLVAFPPVKVKEPIAKILADQGYRQLHVAETEKYAHITYFINGEEERPFSNEERILVPSRGTPHYDQFPQMAAPQITSIIENKFKDFDAILVNYANADMLGHTGNLEATVAGVEEVDKSMGILFELARANNAYFFIVADHGNAEEMIDIRTGMVNTRHSTNPVPFFAVHPSLQSSRIQESLNERPPQGILADVVPTILPLLGITVPKDMTGQNLLE